MTGLTLEQQEDCKYIFEELESFIKVNTRDCGEQMFLNDCLHRLLKYLEMLSGQQIFNQQQTFK